jgi:hypothetical protein
VDFELTEAVICRTPAYDLVDFFEDLDLVITQLGLPKDVDKAIGQLTALPFPPSISRSFLCERATVGTGPFFALALASMVCQDNDPALTRGGSSEYDSSTMNALARRLSGEFRTTWQKLQRLSGAASGMAVYV